MKADLDNKTKSEKQNTPLSLAAGQGCRDTALALVNAGADVNCANSLEKGLIQLAYGCSSSTGELMWSKGAPDKQWSSLSGRSRKIDSSISRSARRALANTHSWQFDEEQQRTKWKQQKRTEWNRNSAKNKPPSQARTTSETAGGRRDGRTRRWRKKSA